MQAVRWEREDEEEEGERQGDGWKGFVQLSPTDGGSVTGKPTTEWSDGGGGRGVDDLCCRADSRLQPEGRRLQQPEDEESSLA